MEKLLLCILLALIVASCTSGPVPISKSIEVPQIANNSYPCELLKYDIDGSEFEVRIFTFESNRDRDDFFDTFNTVPLMEMRSIFKLDDLDGFQYYRSNRTLILFSKPQGTDEKAFDKLALHFHKTYVILEPRRIGADGIMRDYDVTECVIPNPRPQIFDNVESVSPAVCDEFDCQYQKDDCWLANARVANNSDFCDNIYENSYRDLCIYALKN